MNIWNNFWIIFIIFKNSRTLNFFLFQSIVSLCRVEWREKKTDFFLSATSIKMTTMMFGGDDINRLFIYTLYVYDVQKINKLLLRCYQLLLLARQQIISGFFSKKKKWLPSNHPYLWKNCLMVQLYDTLSNVVFSKKI